jgi:hypothetical protein
VSLPRQSAPSGNVPPREACEHDVSCDPDELHVLLQWTCQNVRTTRRIGAGRGSGVWPAGQASMGFGNPTSLERKHARANFASRGGTSHAIRASRDCAARAISRRRQGGG